MKPYKVEYANFRSERVWRKGILIVPTFPSDSNIFSIGTMCFSRTMVTRQIASLRLLLGVGWNQCAYQNWVRV